MDEKAIKEHDEKKRQALRKGTGAKKKDPGEQQNQNKVWDPKVTCIRCLSEENNNAPDYPQSLGWKWNME